jgi:ribosome maturation factor RimP
MGALRPFFSGGLAKEHDLQKTHAKERELEQELTERIQERLPGTEVLAVELLGPDRFCVYIDHPDGVDHALCERVTGLLDDYRRTYAIDVSSPGFERPLRKPEHFARYVGRRVSVRTSDDVGGRKRFRGELLSADDRAVHVSTGTEPVDIPYEQIVRGNLIDEG